MYTQSDLDSIRVAIMALAKGDRVSRVVLSSGVVTEYNQTSLDQLLQLEKTVSSGLGISSSATRSSIVVTGSKGL